MTLISLTKIIVTMIVACMGIAACASSTASSKFLIAGSKSYEASLFRQNCAICHGPEAEGRTLDDGRVVPSLRAGEFKFKTDAEIHKQIAYGGNGMPPFNSQLTVRELNMMTSFVQDKLRSPAQ